jgi:hypothetical protein
MTADEFRELALSLPNAIEKSHMNHPDFRIVDGKIFASLDEKEEWGMAQLKPEDQAHFIESEPEIFVPAAGAWGRGGSTKIHLALANKGTVTQALERAWKNISTKKSKV